MQATPEIGDFSWPHLWTRNCFTIPVAPCTCVPNFSASKMMHWVVTKMVSAWKYFGIWSRMLIWPFFRRNMCSDAFISCRVCNSFQWKMCLYLPLVQPDKMLRQSISDMVCGNRNYFYKNLRFSMPFYNERFSFFFFLFGVYTILAHRNRKEPTCTKSVRTNDSCHWRPQLAVK